MTRFVHAVALAVAPAPVCFAQEDARPAPEQVGRAKLKYTGAEFIAKKLSTQFSTAVVSPDKENNVVYIRGDADTIRRAKERAGQLDEWYRSDDGATLLYLQRTPASEMVATLKAVVALQTLLGDDRDVAIVACEKPNAVFVSGNRRLGAAMVALATQIDGKK